MSELISAFLGGVGVWVVTISGYSTYRVKRREALELARKGGIQKTKVQSPHNSNVVEPTEADGRPSSSGDLQGDVFKSRAYNIATSKTNWLITMTIIEVAVFAFIVIIFQDKTPQSLTDIILKIAIAPSGIFAIGFCGVQYIRERKLEEEYEFKAMLCQSLHQMTIMYKNAASGLESVAGGEQFALLLNEATRTIFSPEGLIDATKKREPKDSDADAKALGPIAQMLQSASEIVKSTSK